jgi:hypothetical protein
MFDGAEDSKRPGSVQARGRQKEARPMASWSSNAGKCDEVAHGRHGPSKECRSTF